MPYSKKVDTIINTKILIVKDITVTRYFFLLLFKFLYDKVPPILNILVIILGTFNFLELVISSELRIF